MKKISYYLILIIIAGSIVVSFWVYQKYFKPDEPNILSFKVEQGSIQEVIRVRGEIAPQKEFDLEFPFAGTVQDILVSQGQDVEQGDILIKLETTDFELELQKFQAQLSQARADLESAKAQLRQYQAGLANQEAKLTELKQGTRIEEIEVAKARVSKAKQSLTDLELNLKNVQQISETEIQKAEQAKQDARENLDNIKQKADMDLMNLYGDVPDTINQAYTVGDNAINKEVNDLFNKSGSSYELSFSTADSQAKTDSQWQRLSAGAELSLWKDEINQLSDDSSFQELDQALIQAKEHLVVLKDFLIRTMDALNSAISTSSVSDTILSTYRTNVMTARTDINTEISNVNSIEQSIADQKLDNQTNIQTAQTSFNTAADALALIKDTNQSKISIAQTKVNEAKKDLNSAEAQLVLKQAGSTEEQIAAQEALVRQAQANISYQEAQIKKANANIKDNQAQIAITEEKIKKSVLYAPVPAKVVKIWLEQQELFRPGQIAITLDSSGYKIQADVSELDIGKIQDINYNRDVRTVGGNDVLIQLDAFPDQELKGKLLSVEPKEIIKEGDKYYRININFNADDLMVRSGMSADLVIYVSKKDNVLKIPEFAVYQKGGKKFADILLEGRQETREIKTGISDGEEIEVKSGLHLGDIVVVSAD